MGKINRNQLVNRLIFETEKVLADKIAERENSEDAKNYKKGLITPNEFLKTTKFKY
jgi:hypothetical protein